MIFEVEKGGFPYVWWTRWSGLPQGLTGRCLLIDRQGCAMMPMTVEKSNGSQYSSNAVEQKDRLNADTTGTGIHSMRRLLRFES